MKFAIRLKLGAIWDWVRAPETGLVKTFTTERQAHEYRRANLPGAGLDEVYVKRLESPEVKLTFADTMPAVREATQ